MDILLDSLAQEWARLMRFAPRIVLAIAVCLAFYGLGRLVGRAVTTVMGRNSVTRTHLAFFRRLSIWVFVLFGLLLALNLLGMGGVSASLLAGGGISAVVLGFAFREIGENFLAGLLLAFSRPFEVGHLIQSAGLEGIVRGIELRYTHIRSGDGRDIFIPSAQILKNALVNYTRDGLRRFSITVGIDYSDDPDRARQLLLDVVRQTDGVLERVQPTAISTALASRFAEIELFWWVDTFDPESDAGRTRTAIVEGCRTALVDAGYTLPPDAVRRVNLEPPPQA